MKHLHCAGVLLVILSVLVITPLKGLTVTVSDTARLNSMARQAQKLLLSKGTLHEADSIIFEAQQLAASGKLEATPLLQWVTAEAALKNQDFGNAFKYASEAMKSMRDLPLQSQAKLMILYAQICHYTGQFSTAIEVLQKNREFVEANHLKGILPLSGFVLAEVYKSAMKQDKAIEALEQLIQDALKEKDLIHAQLAYGQLGVLRLTYNPDYLVTNQYFRKSLDLAKQIGDSSRIALSLTNIAWNLYLQKKLDSSLFYYKYSLTYSSPIRYYTTMANSYGNIGTIFRDLKQYERAKEAWHKGIDIAKSVKDWYTVSWIYNDMSLMAVNNGDYKNAYDCQVLYKQYSDSVGSQKYTSDLTQARIKFDADSKEKELQLLSLRLKNQRLLLYGFAGFLLLALVISLLLLRQFKLRSERRISEMDQKILEVTQANLRQQMNPHFIFNTLNSIQYYMYKHDKLATNNYLTKFSNLMRKILENSQHTSVPVRDELDALQLYLELESIRFRDKFDYEISIDDEIDPLMYKIPTMLIQPYVENAICHGLMLRKEKGKVTIRLILEKEYISCFIEDNGIGREASREINLKKQLNHSSLGTRITESRLKLVNSLYGTCLKTIFTDLKDNLGNAAGTRVEIHIPILI